MRYLVFSDVHGNLPGLRQVLRFSSEKQVDRLVCAGDLVGYHSFANECIQLIREQQITTVKGNHDALLLEELPFSTCNSPVAPHTLRVTQKVVTEDNKKFLQSLPFQTVVDDDFIVIHGSFRSIFETVNTPEKARPALEQLKKDGRQLAFLGHTHRPGIYQTDSRFESISCVKPAGKYYLEENAHYLVNPGTVGQPRHQCGFSFVVYDASEKSVEYFPLEISSIEEKLLRRHDKELFGNLRFVELVSRGRMLGRRIIRKGAALLTGRRHIDSLHSL